MKITNVELFVLKSPGLYNNSEGSEEPLGPTYMGLVKVTTDAGICGYSDMETCARVPKACVEAPERGSRHGVLRRAGHADRGAESAGSGAALVSHVSWQHLLWPSRCSDS